MSIGVFSSNERSDLFEIMRDAYARTEIEIWGENYLRMPQSGYDALIDDGKIFALRDQYSVKRSFENLV